MRAPDRCQVVAWVRSAWDRLSKATIKSRLKKVGLLFNERVKEPLKSSDLNVDNELADTLEALACTDSEVGEGLATRGGIKRLLIGITTKRIE